MDQYKSFALLNMKAHFQDLYEYSHQSDLTTIGLLEKYGSEVPEKIIKNFSHILNAQHLWNHRIEGIKSSFKVWDIHLISQFREINESLFLQSFRIIEKEDFERQVNYINSQGESFTNTVKEILFHVVNHSTYHRGQVMLQLRESGLEAISTDYIFYKRK
ncbi:Uncharacterized damage-inducible protein DinB (forms a four-helix bundle) [Aquiflexum balticum DSM 16537]|uniref:Uncharacterized damage-inducible protein DinB (Forms a four-helix bundle) n=1 Tax=Aquiflexum balticum DSM 16537 TaxID=758820 RepID=A0A1W2H4T5_9BACT|nr:DinB family protein [Aquiflexum balticum]SMD43476.1 Uncharacterized damage-inducible protein DinB (forms a four-helix bundle) [Aquiflexum balticum DSM 16537]